MTGLATWLAQSGVIQGVIIGAAAAFLSALLILDVVARRATTTVNGWSAIRACGRPGNGILLRAACAKALPLVNVYEEAAYWTTTTDEANRRLRGNHDYVLHFSAGQRPPNDAFWSLTATDIAGYMVENPSNRHSVGDRLGLAENPDGSLDIHLKQAAPARGEQNWLPIPPGDVKLTLRAYLPGAAIIEGTYAVPKVVRVR